MWDDITYINSNPHFLNGCNYLSMLGLKLNHVSKRGRWSQVTDKASSLPAIFVHWNHSSVMSVDKNCVRILDDILMPWLQLVLSWLQPPWCARASAGTVMTKFRYLIQCGIVITRSFSPKSLQNTSHSSPTRARYGIYFDTLPQSLQWCMQYHVISDRVKTALDSIYTGRTLQLLLNSIT